jgi:hypothetical protein
MVFDTTLCIAMTSVNRYDSTLRNVKIDPSFDRITSTVAHNNLSHRLYRLHQTIDTLYPF